MATCKADCLYSPVCRLPFNTSETQVEFAEVCHHFKNKADVVEVVYCKDCVCFKQSVSALFPETNCFICDNPYGLKRNIKETDYCSYGERR